jgi:hypothetical protein
LEGGLWVYSHKKIRSSGEAWVLAGEQELFKNTMAIQIEAMRFEHTPRMEVSAIDERSELQPSNLIEYAVASSELRGIGIRDNGRHDK